MSKSNRILSASLIVAFTTLVAGCNEGVVPRAVANASQPITITAIGDEGIILSGANGTIYAYDETYYFAQIVMASGLSVGDTIGLAAELETGQ